MIKFASVIEGCTPNMLMHMARSRVLRELLIFRSRQFDGETNFAEASRLRDSDEG
jgi:hypothetical protein